MDVKNVALRILLVFLAYSSWEGDCYGRVVQEKQAGYYFHSLQVEDGLSQNTIYSIFQDQQGYMWFGTQDGLNRYDGRTFKVFKRSTNDTKSLGNNTVTAITQDDIGQLWVGTGNGAYIYDPISEHFSRFDEVYNNGEVIEGMVRDVQKDKQGNIWLAVFNKGVFRVSSDKKLTYFNLAKDSKQAPVWIRKIAFDNNGKLWIGTYHQGLFCLDPETAEVEQFFIEQDARNVADNDVNDIYLLNAETLLVGTTNKGVQIFNMRTRSFAPLLETNHDGKPLYVRRILRASNGELWFGTESGLYIYNLQTNRYENLRHVSSDHYSISDNAVHAICEDREGGMWLGTFFGGINYFIKPYSLFEKYYPITGENSIKGKSISEFCEIDDEHIWIGTEDAGLHLFNPRTKHFSDGFLPASNIHALMHDTDKLWVGSFTAGVFVIDLNTGTVKNYRNSSNENSLVSNNIYSIYTDYMGTIWVGTMMGLCQYDRDSDTFLRIQDTLIRTQVNDILEDYRGILWFATIGGGLFAYDRSSEEWTHYPSPLADDAAGSKITCLLQDSNNRLWIGSEGAGLYMYEREKDSFTNFYSEDNGLPNNVIYQLVEDLHGNLWGSTNKGLFKLDTKSQLITVYTHANGLLGDQFNYKSGFRSKDGKLYFGGIKGFVAFAPYNSWQNEVPPPVVINSIQLYNREVVAGEKGSPLKNSITYTKEISLPYSTSVFSLGFAALSYVSPQRNQYAYILEGKDKEWIFTDEQSRVTYSNLPPGTYVFRVKASNSDGVWNEDGAHVVINILPPFYRTGWAYFVYFILLSLAVYWTISYFTKRIRMRSKLALQVLENKKEKELYDAKIEFFTNVTHELRTPLSLIKAPLEEIMKNVDHADTNWENLSIMQRNTHRLLKLVNELLDFRKAEAKGVLVNFTNVDIVFVIKDTLGRFMPSAKLTGIAFDTELPDKAFNVDLDIEIFTKIISNLIHNSLKYAKSRIAVSLTHTKEMVRLSIANDGDQINAEVADKIFLPFFKQDESSQGSGLGLPFAKSLTELHNGDLYFDQTRPEMTTFVLELPIYQAKRHVHEETEEETHSNNCKPNQLADVEELLRIDNKKTVLSVEDNVEFQQFMTNQLRDDYHVLQAQNGKMAIDTLEKESVDIIICDIMMPVMDGISFCKYVKENLRFSHIPIILLTAKTSLQAKIDGLKTGADEYIDKPYSIDYLRVRIENLLESRRKIREAYRNFPETAYETIAHSKADEKFLNELIKVIHDHLDEVDLDVDRLAEFMNMSRATFYRKVKHISELTPNDFIRLVRLKKAAELLRQKEYRVSEIAYLVGFNSSSYFSKCFLKQFGVLPKDFDKAGVS